MSPTITDDPAVELPLVERGVLPPRYGEPMQRPFLERTLPLLSDGCTVVDVGAGRSPTIAVEARPPGCRYIGVDISDEELSHAAPGAYDRAVAHDITRPFPADLDPVDLVISWQVLEHVASTADAFTAIRDLLRPGGTMIVQLSGTFAFFAIGSRLMPHPVRSLLMTRVLGMPAEEKFPTRFHRCWDTAIRRSLASWSAVEVVPYFRGAAYLNGAGPLQRAYLGYESVMARRGVANLATHYLVIARR